MLGLVTIGQSPSDDITRSMFDQVRRPRIVQSGALDGLARSEIAELAPGSGDDVLVTRLNDGCEVLVSKEQILDLLQASIDRVTRAGASIVCVLCTGAFPSLTSSAPVVFPDRLVEGIVNSLVPGRPVGVLMPHDDQASVMRRKWSASGRSVVTATFSPYGASTNFCTAIRALNEASVDAIVMDCMGYDRSMLREAQRISRCPVMLANGLVGAVLTEISGASGDE